MAEGLNNSILLKSPSADTDFIDDNETLEPSTDSYLRYVSQDTLKQLEEDVSHDKCQVNERR